MGGKKMRNLSYKKVDERNSGVLCLILCLNSWVGEKRCGKKCIICIITVNADNLVVVSRP